MKLLAVFAAVAVLATLSSATVRKVLKPGQEYVFDHEATVLTHLPDVANQFAGLDISTKLVVQVKQDALIMQMKEIQIGRINEKLISTDPDDIPWKTSSAENLDIHLKTPFRVQYINGKVGPITVHKDAPEVSTNIKKAVASLFNLQLSDQRMNSETYEFNPLKHRSTFTGNQLLKPSDDAEVYTIDEDSIGGLCETLYAVESDPSPYNPTAEVLNVTKIRNYEECKSRPEWVRVTHVPNECIDCDADDPHTLMTVLNIQYDLVKVGEEFVIEQVEALGQVTFNPLTTTGDNFLVNHTITLSILESHPIKSPLPEPIGGKTMPTLEYRFPDADKFVPGPASLKKRPPSFTVQYEGNPVQRAKGLIDTVVDKVINNNPVDMERAPHEILAIITHMRSMSHDEIQETIRDSITPNCHYSNGTASVKCQLLTNLLAITGTGPSVIVLKQKIVSGEIRGELATQAIMMLPTHILEPTPVIVEEIRSLAKSQFVRTNPQMRKTAWLSFATLVFQACEGEEESPSRPLPPYIKTFCTRELERKHVFELADELRNCRTIEEKFLFIRALGLTGLPQAVKPLADIALGRQPEIDNIRAAALHAMTKIAKYGDEDNVQDIAEDVFYNTDNPTMVRLAALTLLMKCKPDFDDLQKLAGWSWTEDDDQVGNYLYSIFDSLSNSSHPCMKSLASDLSDLLPFVKEVDIGIQASNLYEISDYDEDYALGSQMYVRYYGSNHSMIPDSGRFVYNVTRAGYSVRPLVLSYSLHNLQSLLDKTIGPKAAYPTFTTSEINQIPNMPDIKPREQDKFFAKVDLSMFDTQHRQFFLTEDNLSDLLKSGMIPDYKMADLKTGIPINYAKIMIPANIHYHIPCELGLPMLIQVANPTILRIVGSIRGEWESLSPSNMAPPKIRGIVKLHASLSTMPTARVGVVDVFQKKIVAAKVSTNIYVSLPVVADAKVDLEKGQLHVELAPSSREFGRWHESNNKLFTYKVRPVTTNEVSLFPERVEMSKSKLVRADEDPDKLDIDLSRQYLGLPLRVKMVTERDNADIGTLWSTFEDNELISILTSWWIPSEFKFHEFEIVLQNVQESNGIEIVLGMNYEPTPIEKMILEHNHKKDPRGVLQYLMGWAELPDRCSDKSFKHPYGPIESSSSDIGLPWHKKPTRYNIDDIDKYQYISYSEDSSNYEFDINKPQSTMPYNSDLRSRSSSDKIVMVPRSGEISKLQLDLKIGTKGATKLLVNTVLTSNDDILQDILAVTVDCNSIPMLCPNKMQLCLTSTVQYPEVPCDYASQLSPNSVKPLKGQFKLSWGGSCSSTPQVTGHILLEKTLEQKDLESNKKSWYFTQCQEDFKKGMKNSYACNAAAVEIGSLGKVTVEIDYRKTEIPLSMFNATIKMDNFMKYYLYKQMSNNPVGVHNPENHLKIVAKYHIEVPAIDLKIYKPHENTFYHKCYIDDILPFVYPYSTQATMLEQYIDDITGEMETPTCTVSAGKYIDMFDNFTIRYPLNECYHIVARDCSPNSLFNVLLAKDKSSNTKSLIVRLLAKKIEVRPMGSFTGNFKVNIDGETLTAPSDKVIVLKRNSNEKIVAMITAPGPELHIIAPDLGVRVIFDGEDLDVQVSNMWRGKLCGLCGEFQGDESDSLIGPKECLYPDPIGFGLSYAIPSSRCSLPTPPNPNKQCDQSVSTSSRYTPRSYIPRRIPNDYNEETIFETRRYPEESRKKPSLPWASRDEFDHTDLYLINSKQMNEEDYSIREDEEKY